MLLIFILSPGTPIILLQTNIWGFEGDLRITTSPLSYFENFVVMCSEMIMSSENMVGSIEGPEHYSNHNEKIIKELFKIAITNKLTTTNSAMCSTKQCAIHPYCKTHNPTPNPLPRILRIISSIYEKLRNVISNWKL
jgi:hypothetical protein